MRGSALTLECQRRPAAGFCSFRKLCWGTPGQLSGWFWERGFANSFKLAGMCRARANRHALHCKTQHRQATTVPVQRVPGMRLLVFYIILQCRLCADHAPLLAPCSSLPDEPPLTLPSPPAQHPLRRSTSSRPPYVSRSFNQAAAQVVTALLRGGQTSLHH